ncbi:MAG: 23S rRNA (pseudouridine(1915)-N(3))-methyltransferase RlmH [Oscillospiraceae bacterium]|nr:23S rRNA (pseudouridine(1915)-N(3))-methyltransferase RlmH [Oscillospiraceae bacterium]MBQ6802426.1 23S rRNA (pseudouridine(1915)-N(3))-methyltransferase RlmH [Oscillospiraceae bacterium]
MRTINIICVGNLKEKYLREAAAEYEKRLSAYCKLKITELSEYKLPDKPSAAEIAKCIEAEGTAIAAKIPQNAVIAAMCIEGEMLSSEGFSIKLENLMSDESASELCFVIGGSYGLSDEIKKKAKFKLSLSRMTFTHQISRVLILEQIYRAFQISTGGKYHK